MAVNTLDPQTALVVIDLQKGTITDLDAELHGLMVAKVFPRLGETGTVEDILGLPRAKAA